ncbi:hypothetical protein AB3K78_01255 [Leucobacter sp. HNU]|uniref:hypothetical protein n=1 Tax=Leucobacter sp. HNU TaxID=3236805 RepID=UPI003A81162B
MKAKRVSGFVVGAVVFCATLGAGITPALAVDSSKSPSTETVRVEMYPESFDPKAAKAQGFEIQVNKDGTQQAVPLTAEAKAAVAQFPELAEPQVVSSTPAATRAKLATARAGDGACGYSTLQINPSVRGGLNITTGYASYKGPTIFHKWIVRGNTVNTAFSEDFTGYNASTTWSAMHYHPVMGYAHGSGGLGSDSYIRLLNTLSCRPLNYTTSW